MKKDFALRDGIHKIVETLVDEGIVEKVPFKERVHSGHQIHYLPWHAVLKPDHPTTPVRLVHKASQKDKNGLSLNDCQDSGPNLLPDLTGLMLKWRRYKVAIVADVSKMFLRLNMKIDQRDLHQFLFQLSEKDLLQVWRYTKVLFGEK